MASSEDGSPAGAGLLVVLASPFRGRGLLGLVGWMGAGAGVLGVVGWGLAVAVVPSVAPAVALGFGLAVGGGLGALVQLLVLEDGGETEPETVTVGGGETPAPRPADLFEGHPDPVLYYGDAEGTVVVRAVNPAFAAAFDVSADAVTGAPLREVVAGTERAGALADAAVTGAEFDERLACETGDGSDRYRVRVVAESGAGYVVYTPV